MPPTTVNFVVMGMDIILPFNVLCVLVVYGVVALSSFTRDS